MFLLKVKEELIYMKEKDIIISFQGGSDIPTNNHHIIDAYKIIKGLKQSFFSYIYIGE